MKIFLSVTVAVSAWLSCAAPGLSAQGPGNDCDFQSFRVLTSREPAAGQRVTWIGLPDIACSDGVRIRADSAVVWEAAQRTEFLGQFRYVDAERELQADSADYYEREGRLFARGQAELRTTDGATILRGDTLNLYEGADGAADDRLELSGQRAFALIHPADSTGNAMDEAPYEVLAERLRFEGERFLFGEGDVQVARDSLHAVARSLSFDRERGSLVLLDDARVESGETETVGRRITLELPQNELREMLVEEEGRLLTGDLDLSGDEIRVEFEEGTVSYLTASRGEPDDEAATEDPDPDSAPSRPEALAEGLYLTGNTIEVDAPAGVLETVFAEGEARGESLGAGEEPPEGPSGGIDPEAPEAPPEDEVLNILKHDWIEGETVTALFRQLEASQDPDDEAAEQEPQYVLERLTAEGNARTLYRSPPQERAGAPDSVPAPDRSEWAVSYLVADQLVLDFVDGQVEEVQAQGTVSGVQLEPQEAPVAVEEAEDSGTSADPEEPDVAVDP